MDLNLKNKVVLIAGSSKGIGLPIAHSFLKEGSALVISGRDAHRLEQVFVTLKQAFPSSSILRINADLCDEHSIQAALKEVVSHHGHLDCVIANIGSGAEKMGLDFDQGSLGKSFEKNLQGSLLLSKHALDIFRKQKSGNFIFISSIAGLEDIKAPIAYSAHKAALSAAAKKLAREAGQWGVRINTIAPGNILCEGGTWDKKLKEDAPQVNTYITTEVPLQCLGTPEDVANMALFLASDKAKFITGATMVVDGGQTRSF